MRRTILSLCVLSVLAWAVNAQAQDKGKEQPGQGGATAKADANAPAAEKKAAAPQGTEKEAREKAKSLRDQVREQAQTRGKAMKDQVAEQAAQVKGKGREQQVAAAERQAQNAAAKHMERQARLARLRELAIQKDDKDMIARIDKLIAKENEVHTRKLQRVKGGPQGAGEMKGLEKAEPARPAETKPEGQAATPAQPKTGEAATPAAPAAKPVETQPPAQPKQ